MLLSSRSLELQVLGGPRDWSLVGGKDLCLTEGSGLLVLGSQERNRASKGSQAREFGEGSGGRGGRGDSLIQKPHSKRERGSVP